jgi:hypothetical protein
MIGSLSRGLRLPPVERRLALEALAGLALARLVLAVLPFPTAMARLGLRQKPAEGMAASSSAPDAASIAAVAVAVRRAGRVAPFRAVCLQQSVAAALMLRRRRLPAEIYFGVAKPRGAAMQAHAWSVCGEVVVTGEEGMDRYTPLAVFSV